MREPPRLLVLILPLRFYATNELAIHTQNSIIVPVPRFQCSSVNATLSDSATFLSAVVALVI
jgi:hypothetical protein